MERQGARGAESSNASADDSHASHHSAALEKRRGTADDGAPVEENCCAAPRSEGGREEEENRSGIAAKSLGRLRSMENVASAWTMPPSQSSRCRLAAYWGGTPQAMARVELISSKYNSSDQELKADEMSWAIKG
jgi:hypothetical protein